MPNQYFEYDWFDGREHYFQKYLHEYKSKSQLKFLEVGSFEGKSTCWMLNNVPHASITCIDSWKGGAEHGALQMDVIEQRFLNNIEVQKNRVEILKGLSKDVLLSLQSLRQKYYDFIYIDGGHTVKDVLNDLILSFELLKIDGIMAMDDFLWGSKYDKFQLEDDQRPEMAIRIFLLGYKNQIQVMDVGAQVWIRRIS